MTANAHPSWVDSLDSAKAMFTKAADAQTPEERESLTHLGYAWLDVTRLYKGD